MNFVFPEIPDRRMSGKCAHKLEDILVISAAAVLCGSDNFKAIGHFGVNHKGCFTEPPGLKNGVPSHDTFRRVLSAMSSRQLETWFRKVASGFIQEMAGELVAIDGKTIRGSAGPERAADHVVSARAGKARLTLGQVRVTEKSNEIKAIPKLLRALDLAGAVVTIDAMGCQKETAREIADAGADYVLAMKDNQPTLSENAECLIDGEIAKERTPGIHNPHLDVCEEADKVGGRLENADTPSSAISAAC